MNKQFQTNKPVDIFFSYSHKDEDLRDELEKHLSVLKRQGVINSWHDRRIGAGSEWGNAIDRKLKSAKIILLLVSPDFLASDYCNDIELVCAMELHNEKKAIVIPVILRPSDWKCTLINGLQALPKDGKPVTVWKNRDQAFLDVTDGIRTAVQRIMHLETRELSTQTSHFLSTDTILRNHDIASNVKWVIVLSGTIDDIDKDRAKAIVEHLRKISKDSELTLTRIESGSVKLHLESGREAFETIYSLTTIGRLTSIADHKVTSVYSAFGGTALFVDSNTINSRVDSILHNTKNQLLIQGISLSRLFHNNYRLGYRVRRLLERGYLERGRSVKILLLHPESDEAYRMSFLEYRGELSFKDYQSDKKHHTSSRVYHDILHSLDQIKRVGRQLSDRGSDRLLECRLYRSTPAFFLMISDQTALAELHQMKDDFAKNVHIENTNIPVVEYRQETASNYAADDIGRTGYVVLMSYFNFVWSGAYGDNLESHFIDM